MDIKYICLNINVKNLFTTIYRRAGYSWYLVDGSLKEQKLRFGSPD